MKKGQLNLAMADFNKAIELNPQNETAYANRGIIYGSMSQKDLAIADYNKAIELNPQNPANYIIRGITYESKHQYDLAIADFNKIIELNPQNPQNFIAYDNRGNAYKDQRQLASALADYREAIKLNPQYAYAYYDQAAVLNALGMKAEAINSVKQFLQYASPGDALIAKAKQYIIELGGQL